MIQVNADPLITLLNISSSRISKGGLSNIETNAKTPPLCYQTDERYFCNKNCMWRSACKTLTAAWLRRN